MVTVSTTTRTAQDLTAQARDVLGVSRLTNHALTSWLHGLPGVDQVGCEARAAALGTRSVKTTSKAWAIDTAIGMIDLTTLEGSDTVGKVRSLCAKALVPDPLDPTTPRPAAICVYGDMVATAKAALGDSGIHVAAVATAFPSGRASMAVKLADTRDAVEAGADEIDMVIDRGAFLSGDHLTVFNQIAEVKAACGAAHLKVIMETGELVTYDNVRRASYLSMLAGADFIKTSTGKIQPAATLPVTLIMLEAVRDWRDLTGSQVGRQAGRRHQDHQGRHQVPRHGQRDRRRRLALARVVPLRGLEPAQRPPPAAPEAHHGCLLRRRLRDDRLTTAPHTTAPTKDTLMPKFEYAPAPESRAIVTIEKSYGLFIDGAFTRPKATFPTINPADETVLAEVSQAGPKDVDKAVAAARRAYEGVWGRMSGAERGKYLFRIARILQERAREFAVLESLDNGKPIKETRDFDVPTAAAHFFYHAGWADKLEYAGLSAPGSAPARAHGVVAQIIPWNFPLLMLAWKVAPALATGNTVVLKPAETTPLSALLFAEVCQQAELPAGVVNIVTGDGRTGQALVEHPDVDKIAFTGSTEVGKTIARSIAGTAKKATLELGGKAANIIFDDAPIEQAVEGIVGGIFFNQGQVCCAGSRLLVQENVHDQVIAKLKRRLQTLRVGDPLDKNSDLGAINSREQLDRITTLVDAGVAEGAERWSPACTLPTKGFWYPPTLLTGVSQTHRVATEEIFGPVLSVLTFRTPQEAVAKANNTAYGLSAGVWTEKGSRILWMADQLKAGVVWANTFNRFDPSSPFGGYKESGYGREGGRHGLEAYVTTAPATLTGATR